MQNIILTTIALLLSIVSLCSHALTLEKTIPVNASILIPNHAVILLYHHVSEHTPAITSISPTIFEQQLQHLEQNHFNVWPLPKIIDYFETGKPLPDKTVAITFDDSYQSVYTEAYPRLKKRHWPFTIFVSTESIDQGYNFQTSWEQLRLMAANGATIANHSTSHQHLLFRKTNESNKQWRQRIRLDIQSAQQRIKQEIGSDHKLFAYPYGEYNRELTSLLESLGYTGFGQQSGAVGKGNYQPAAPRFPFAGKYIDADDFALKLMTLPLSVTIHNAEQNPLNNRQAKPQLNLTINDKNLNAKALQCFANNQGRLTLQWHENHSVTISPKQEITIGRSRYNCTLPAGDKRYYWFSHPWIRLDTNDQWVLD